MRKVVFLVAAPALILSLGACSDSPPKQSTGDSNGVTGATVRRAAVLGGHVDFGANVDSVENDDLDTQGASIANPLDASDFARDQEIDSIVGKNPSGGEPSHKGVHAPASSAKPAPAVPPGSSGATGVTGGLAPASPLESAGNPATGEDAAMAAAQARAFAPPGN